MGSVENFTEAEFPVLVVIPARGGSKRILKKNIRSFLGIPILTRVITEIEKSTFTKAIVVSTDSEDIAKVALEAGAITHIRPSELADDFVGLLDVMKYEITEYIRNHTDVQYVCCVLPTAVLMDPHDLSKSLTLSLAFPGKFIVSIGKYRSSVWRALQQDTEGQLSMIFPNNVGTRTQDLPDTFHDAGQFYVAHRDTWLNASSILSHDLYGIEVSEMRVQDIDSEGDWIQAEQAFSILNPATPRND